MRALGLALGLVVLAGALTACGPPTVIRGRVLGDRGGLMRGAEVSTEPPTDIAQTTRLGDFALVRRIDDEGEVADIEPGAYTLTVRQLGYVDVAVPVNVTAGVVVVPTIRMAPDPLAPRPASDAETEAEADMIGVPTCCECPPSAVEVPSGSPSTR